jgi:diacylglycerol kinase (ATP)
MTKPSKSVFNIAGVFRALGYSLAGLKAALVHERAFRQEAVLFLILAPLGAWLGGSWIEKTLLVAVLFVVLIVELLNSAIETVVDRIGTEQNELSGRAKDIGSAAVFLSITLVILVWSWILIPPLL